MLRNALVLLLTASVSTHVCSGAQAAPPAEGSLVICGGGSLPKAILLRFVELAGGDRGKLVVIPTAGTNEAALSTATWKRIPARR